MHKEPLGAFLGVVLLCIPGVTEAAPIIGLGNPINEVSLAGGNVVRFDFGPAGQFPSIAFLDVTFIGVGADLTIGPDFNGLFNATGGNSLFNGNDVLPDIFRFDFATPIDAFAFNFGASNNTWLLSAFDLGGTLLETLTISPVLGSNAGEYFGIAASSMSFATLIDQKDILPEGDGVVIDDFTYNGSGIVQVSEPSAFFLSLVALVGLGLIRRSQRAGL